MKRLTKLPTATLFALAVAFMPSSCLFGGDDSEPIPDVVTPEMALAAENARQFDRSAEMWHKLHMEGGGQQLEPYLGCGRSFLAAGDVRSACAIVEQGLGVLPNEIELHLLHGRVLEQAKFQRAAERCYEGAVGLAPDNYDALIGLGRVRVRLGLEIRAWSTLQRVHEMRPDDLEGLELYAIAAEDMRLFVQAYEARRSILLINPKPEASRYVNAAHLAFYPSVIKVHPDSIDQAHAWVERAIELNPQGSEAHYLLALSLGNRGDSERAREHYIRAIEVDPGNVAAIHGLAKNYHVAGFAPEADRFARLALGIDKDRARRAELEGYLQSGDVRDPQALQRVKDPVESVESTNQD